MPVTTGKITKAHKTMGKSPLFESKKTREELNDEMLSTLDKTSAVRPFSSDVICAMFLMGLELKDSYDICMCLNDILSKKELTDRDVLVLRALSLEDPDAEGSPAKFAQARLCALGVEQSRAHNFVQARTNLSYAEPNLDFMGSAVLMTMRATGRGGPKFSKGKCMAATGDMKELIGEFLDAHPGFLDD